jgi:hypothetical protein
MPTSEASGAAALALAALALAGCDAAALPGGSPTRLRVDVAGEPLTIAAPPGFCIDRRSTTVSEDGAFVLMSDCGLLGAGRGGGTPVGAALTASVSAGPIGGEGDDPVQSLEDLREFAATPEGRAVVGRGGRSDRVRILAARQRDGVLYLLVEDRSSAAIAGIDRQFWRAFMDVNGRMTALSVLGFEGAGLDAQQGLNHLAALAAAIRQANPPS